MESLWSPSLPLAHFALRGVVVYLFVLLLLRVSGKRQIGQMGSAEFVALLLVSNAVQNSMNGGDNSITGGLVDIHEAVLEANGSLSVVRRADVIESPHS